MMNYFQDSIPKRDVSYEEILKDNLFEEYPEDSLYLDEVNCEKEGKVEIA